MKYYIAFVSFSLIIAACSNNQPKKREISQKTGPAAYTLATVEKEAVAASIKLPAQFAAYQEVSIFPKVNGYVKSVTVDIGSKVSKGQLLMVLEAPELLQAALQAKEKYARSKADFTTDKEHYLRFLEASATAGAISPLDLSTLRGKMEADSLLSNAEKMNWQMQETMLGYLRVTAPFSGVVTERNVHPGALVSAAAKDKPMLELKQVEHLRLQVEVPEAFAAGLKNKDTVSFYVGALHGKKMSGYISRQSMNMNAQYRSEKMEIDVQNKNGNLAPGMYADIILYSNGDTNALSVPSSAVVISTERKYVLLSKNRKISKVDVITGNEKGGKTEIFGNLQPGDNVIANATDEIKEE
jgi:membrane fusion protein (multidrug efflux system)